MFDEIFISCIKRESNRFSTSLQQNHHLGCCHKKQESTFGVASGSFYLNDNKSFPHFHLAPPAHHQLLYHVIIDLIFITLKNRARELFVSFLYSYLHNKLFPSCDERRMFACCIGRDENEEDLVS